MKTTHHNSDLPSTGRLIVFLIVISGLCFLSTVAIHAQTRTISGHVRSTLDDQPLKSAAITTISPGPDIYVFTDENGRFEITLPDRTTSLIACSWGLKTKTISIRGRSQIDIELEPENVVFDEVLVVYFVDSAAYKGYYQPDRIEAIYKLSQKPNFFGFLSNR
jgi:hypothetical protein